MASYVDSVIGSGEQVLHRAEISLATYWLSFLVGGWVSAAAWCDWGIPGAIGAAAPVHADYWRGTCREALPRSRGHGACNYEPSNNCQIRIFETTDDRTEPCEDREHTSCVSARRQQNDHYGHAQNRRCYFETASFADLKYEEKKDHDHAEKSPARI